MMTLTSFPPAFKASSRVALVNVCLASNLVFVFAVVPSVSKYHSLLLQLICCNRQNTPIDSSQM